PYNTTSTSKIYTLSLHDALPILTKQIIITIAIILVILVLLILGIRFAISVIGKLSSGVRLGTPSVQTHPVTFNQSNQPIENIQRSEEHTSELQSPCNLVCRLLLE